MVTIIIIYLLVGILLIGTADGFGILDISYEEYGSYGLAVILWPVVIAVLFTRGLGYLASLLSKLIWKIRK